MASFTSLPNELIIRIFCHLPSYQHVLDAGLACKEFYACTQVSEVFRSLLSSWTYSEPVPHTTPLRDVLLQRLTADVAVDSILADCIAWPRSARTGRTACLNAIVALGYDAKDRLLYHMATREDAHDVLARRYWAKEALTAVYRAKAIATLDALYRGEEMPLEEALMCVDLFWRDDERAGTQWTGERLDALAREFRSGQSGWEALSTGERAQRLHAFFVEDGFLTRAGDGDYYSLVNNFATATFENDGRTGLPLTFAVIYCAVARRLGIDATPTHYPGHVYVVVFSPYGQDIKGKLLPEEDARDRMFLDIYTRPGERCVISETEEHAMRQRLAQEGLDSDSIETCFEPATHVALLLRQRNNIVNFIRHIVREENAGAPPDAMMHDHASSILYAVQWISLFFPAERSAAALAATRGDQHGRNTILERYAQSDFELRRRHVTDLVRRMEASFPSDAEAFGQKAIPLFAGHVETIELRQVVKLIHEADGLLVHPKRRRPRPEPPASRTTTSTPSPSVSPARATTPPLPPSEWHARASIQHRIGSVFQHARYAYTGLIIGWDASCAAPTGWQVAHAVNELPGGSEQCFYNVIAADGSERYVAQENIRVLGREELGSEMPGGELGKRAGRWFLRWDGGEGRFVSNLRAQYPDD